MMSEIEGWVEIGEIQWVCLPSQIAYGGWQKIYHTMALPFDNIDDYEVVCLISVFYNSIIILIGPYGQMMYIKHWLRKTRE